MQEENRLSLYSISGDLITSGSTSGSRLADGRLRINLNNSEKSGKLKGILDSIIEKSDLVKIVLVENITIKLIDEYEYDYDEDPRSRDEMIKYLISMNFEVHEAYFKFYSDEDLTFICKWYLTGAPNYLIVNILENYFRANNRFLEVQRKEDK